MSEILHVGAALRSSQPHSVGNPVAAGQTDELGDSSRRKRPVKTGARKPLAMQAMLDVREQLPQRQPDGRATGVPRTFCIELAPVADRGAEKFFPICRPLEIPPAPSAEQGQKPPMSGNCSSESPPERALGHARGKLAVDEFGQHREMKMLAVSQGAPGRSVEEQEAWNKARIDQFVAYIGPWSTTAELIRHPCTGRFNVTESTVEKAGNEHAGPLGYRVSSRYSPRHCRWVGQNQRRMANKGVVRRRNRASSAQGHMSVFVGKSILIPLEITDSWRDSASTIRDDSIQSKRGRASPRPALQFNAGPSSLLDLARRSGRALRRAGD